MKALLLVQCGSPLEIPCHSDHRCLRLSCSELVVSVTHYFARTFSEQVCKNATGCMKRTYHGFCIHLMYARLLRLSLYRQWNSWRRPSKAEGKALNGENARDDKPDAVTMSCLVYFFEPGELQIIEQLGITLEKKCIISRMGLQSYIHYQCTVFKSYVCRAKHWQEQSISLLRAWNCAWLLHGSDFREPQRTFPHWIRCRID